ncbi:hypothetical protein QRX50_16710 [Amycolatopsis carbonis]|uniref:PH domain-containing protein n=1 Tax=Amycolatopsis carbonis TaxID=715471 RepID=A0A9Y2INJ1_9PSEU|nr:hypothetical protein [Amycolatopsis sp. 2-15]WIX82281.1 hypothetical protein QRX50_16710 [Amycolatopsis sp. 2-15]
MNAIEDGETVLWTGRPQRRHRRFHDYLPWAVVVVLIVGDGVVLAFYADFSLWMIWFYMIALAVGVAIHSGSVRSKRHAATSYPVTDRRLIIAMHFAHGVDYRWVPMAVLGTPRVHELHDGLGTVDFKKSVLRATLRLDPWRQSTLVPIYPELVAIRDAHEVAELIERHAGQASIRE